MRYTIQDTEDGLVVILEGEFDLYSSVDLRKLLLERVAAEPLDICLDCSGVDYIDSSGMGLIMQLYAILKKNNRTFTIKGLSESIMKLFRAIRLDKALGSALVEGP